jgi:hypothetical protein
MCRRALGALAVVLVGCVAATPLAAQTERGTIIGRITDQTGGVLPGVTITVTNSGTGMAQTFVSNQNGIYEAPFLIPGSYTVVAALSGFQPITVSPVVVNVGARVRADATLAAAGVKTEVIVVARPPLVQTESASIGQVIGSERLQTLPTSSQNVYEFMTLTSTVTAPPGGNAPAFRIESGGSFAISGSRPSSVTFKIDGQSNTDPTFGTPTITPSLDSVQEFQLQNNAYSAEYEGIGQVNIATRSGASGLHGSTFEYLQNEALQPRSPVTHTKSRLRYNDFGATFGGPVWGLGDRAFFFFSYEGKRTDSLGSGLARVLTGAERQGDFSASLGGCLTSGGATVPLLGTNGLPTGACLRQGQLFDPQTTTANPAFDSSKPVSLLNPQYIRQPLANNQIPSTRISGVARQLIDAQQPLPNLSDPTANYTNLAGTTFDNNQYSLRLDYNMSASDRVYGRVAVQNNLRDSQPLLPFQSKGIQGDGRVVSLNWARVLGPRAANEFRAGYVRGVYGDHIDEVDPKQFGIQNTFLPTLPRIFIRPGNINFGGFSASVLTTMQDTYQISDNLSFIKGRHSFKAGAALDYNRFTNGELGNNTGGTGTFGGLYTIGTDAVTPTTENAIADFLLGVAETSSVNAPSLSHVSNGPWHAYIQDDWQVSDRFVLNLGLRYEYHQPWKESSRGGALFEPTGDGVLRVANRAIAEQANSPFVACCTGARVVPADKNDFAPRLSAVYRPFAPDSLVVRAGYGMFYSDMTQFFNWRQYEPLIVPSFQGNNGDFLTSGARLDNLFPSSQFSQGGGIEPFFPSGVPPALLGHPVISFSAFGPNRTPYMHQWSVSLQRELMPNLLGEVAYAGSAGRNLPIQWIFNQPTPSPIPANFASADPQANPYLRRPFGCCSTGAFVMANILESSYHAVTAKLDKRFANGYQFLTTYTWSRSIDQGSEVFAIGNTFNILANNRDPNVDRGRSSYDVPHRWVTSGTVELPFGRGRRFLDTGGVANALAGGWRLAGIFTLQSGFPFTPNIRNRRSNTGFALATERGDLVGDPYWSDSAWQQKVEEWKHGSDRLFVINPASIGLDYPQGTFGNIPRNFFRAPFGYRLDLSLAKAHPIGPARLEVRADVFNVTSERLHRLDLSQAVRATNFLTNATVGSIAPYAFMFNPRVIQVSAKLTF